jgi:hypothetical protein
VPAGDGALLMPMRSPSLAVENAVRRIIIVRILLALGRTCGLRGRSLRLRGPTLWRNSEEHGSSDSGVNVN